MNSSPLVLRKVPGFEATAYAYLNEELVWLGASEGSGHPRNAHQRWQPPRLACDAKRLAAGARSCLRQFDALSPRGLLLWLTGRPLPFPLQVAATRFDAIRAALERNDIDGFAAAAVRVLGLGHGLTPSGDDFVGGIFFALAHAPRQAWAGELGGVRASIRAAATTSTNVISAALLDDLIDGASHAPLHALLAALQDDAPAAIASATRGLLRVGATSGADMLAGLLVALLTLPPQDCPATIPT